MAQNPLDIGYRSLRTFYCGGNWNNGSNAGVFYLNGNNARSNTNTNIGFRSALPPSQILQACGPVFSAEGNKGICFLSWIFRLKNFSCICRRSDL